VTSMSNDNVQPSSGGRRSTNTLNEGLLSQTTKTDGDNGDIHKKWWKTFEGDSKNPQYVAFLPSDD